MILGRSKRFYRLREECIASKSNQRALARNGLRARFRENLRRLVDPGCLTCISVPEHSALANHSATE